jgi:hypothetical protein
MSEYHHYSSSSAFIRRREKDCSGSGCICLSISGTDGSENAFPRLSWDTCLFTKVYRDVIFLIQRHGVKGVSLLSRGRLFRASYLCSLPLPLPLVLSFCLFLVLLTHLEIRISVAHCIGKGSFILFCGCYNWGSCVFLYLSSFSHYSSPPSLSCLHHISHLSLKIMLFLGGVEQSFGLHCYVCCLFFLIELSRYCRYSLYIVRSWKEEGPTSLRSKGMGGAKEIF